MAALKINKNILLVIALIVVAGVGYYIFSNSSDEAALTTITGNAGSVPIVGQQLVVELNRLKALRSVDSSFLSDPVFASLQDFTEPVPPQPLGRPNPFAPVGDDF